jgi:hypothetical protein
MKKAWFSNLKNESFQKVDLPFKNIIIIFLFINLLIILLTFLLRNFIPPEVPIFYGMPEGEEQLVPGWGLAIPSIISRAILGLNCLIAFKIKDEFTKKVLVLGGLASTIFSIITIIKIFLIVNSLF